MVHIDRIKRLVWGALIGVTFIVVSPVQAASQLYFIHNDHLGAPQAVTDQNQNFVWRKRQKPFGETIEETAAIDQNVRFPGQYFDEESGYHYNYFRDYDPTVGRYIQSDPIGLVKDYSDPMMQVSMNLGIQIFPIFDNYLLNHLYQYGKNNPIINTDIFGLIPDSYRLWLLKQAARNSEIIAQGNKIRKVKKLCDKWGGRPKDWKKKKGWDPEGTEWHWYEKGGQRFGVKRAGEVDPF